MARAVVFGYHQIGVRCLRVLLAHRVDVALVVTHADNPGETIWFDSVAAVAAEYDIPVRMPDDPNTPGLVAEIEAMHPDFLFSFYYRRMLGAPLLALPSRGAFNMHGSLLPKFRGRAPVNWAVLAGERETGATLHYMVEKPDAGDLVAQMAVPILPDDTAHEVFAKVTVAAELTLDRVLPDLVAGTGPRIRQNLGQGRYYGARRPEDGIIDWTRDAFAIHNLVRAVAPPYPGAFTTVAGVPARVLRTRVLDPAAPVTGAPTLAVVDDRLVAQCGGGGSLAILALEVDSQPVGPAAFGTRFGASPVVLGSPSR
jgi:methionyl-tRNA formyltransferase